MESVGKYIWSNNQAHGFYLLMRGESWIRFLPSYFPHTIPSRYWMILAEEQITNNRFLINLRPSVARYENRASDARSRRPLTTLIIHSIKCQHRWVMLSPFHPAQPWSFFRTTHTFIHSLFKNHWPRTLPYFWDPLNADPCNPWSAPPPPSPNPRHPQLYRRA